MAAPTPNSSPPARPKAAVVIVNWNGGLDTLGCLASLRSSTTALHAIVVDNGSSDRSADQIERSGLADTLLRLPSNRGYTGGNNAGLKHALDEGFDVVIVLNNDTVVEAEALGRLVSYLSPEQPPRAVSPEITYLDRPSDIWFAGAVIDKGWPRYLQAGELAPSVGLRDSEWLSGCCIAARRETWLLAGLFDPSYFLIFEDAEWSLRARRQGIELGVVTCSVIRHKVSASFSAGPTSLLGSFYFVRNGLRLEKTHCPRYLPRFVTQWLVRATLSALVHRRGRREILLRWLGAFAFVIGSNGKAPRSVEHIAARLS